MIRLLYLAIFSLLLSCGSKTSKPKTTTPTTPTPSQQKNPVPAGPAHPSITPEIMQDVFQRAESLDFIFYDLPISMNVDTKGGVQQLLSFVSTTPTPKSLNCKPTGRLSFQSQGEFILEADFHLGDGCYYYTFMEDNKPIYSNMITEQGITYFKNMLANLPKTAPKQ